MRYKNILIRQKDWRERSLWRRFENFLQNLLPELRNEFVVECFFSLFREEFFYHLQIDF